MLDSDEITRDINPILYKLECKPKVYFIVVNT